MRNDPSFVACVAALVASGCAEAPPDPVEGQGGLDSYGSSGIEVEDDGFEERLDLGATTGEDANAEGGGDCEAELVPTDLVPVSLGFAFDVSASMGNFDEPWYDPALKWEPVVSAMKGFFSDQALAGVEASMTFFPASGAKCETSTYATPDVAPALLPTGAFADAMDAITPQTPDQWRSGTPTFAVAQATLDRLEAQRVADPTTRFAFVLVTDGYPQGCEPPANDIGVIADLVASHALDIPTYVVGVTNPPPGPDVVTDLQTIAAAGGSDAFLVETGDPAQTAAAFSDAVVSIQAALGDCRLALPPPPPGVAFDPTKINVRYDGEELGYDPECASGVGWRFDDPNAPMHIVLCDDLCDTVQHDPDRELILGFGCERRPFEP